MYFRLPFLFLALVPTAYPQETPAVAFLADQHLDVLPMDLAVSPNGLVAIVRSSDDWPTGTPQQGITAWDMTTGSQIAVTVVSNPPPAPPTNVGVGASNSQGPMGMRFASDHVEMTNDRAIVIGSKDNSAPPAWEDALYIDVFSVGSNPPGVALLQHHEFFGATQDEFQEGDAHDVAITRNGALAVVHSANWVRFVNMSTGTIVASDHIGNLPGGPTGTLPCSPCHNTLLGGYGAVDSVAVTDERAVVITTRLVPQATGPALLRMWAYVYDLTVVAPARISGFDCIGPTTDVHLLAHDVAITPDGGTAIATGVGMVVRINLTNGTAQFYQDISVSRGYRVITDSVEVTTTRAVVIADIQFTGPNPAWRSVIEIFDLQPAPTFAPMRSYRGPEVDDLAVSVSDGPHDLAITPNGQMAVVRTERHIVVFSDLTNPPLPVTGPYGAPALPSFLSRLTNSNARNAGGSFVPNVNMSDSVTVTNSAAVAIGTKVADTPQQLNVGEVYIFSLPPPVGFPGSLTPIIEATPGAHLTAADVRLIPRGVAVRFSDQLNDPGSGPNARNIVLYSFNGTAFFRCGAGQISLAPLDRFGVDCVEAGPVGLLSVGCYITPSSSPPSGEGWATFIKY